MFVGVLTSVFADGIGTPRQALHWMTQHTGIPIVIVAAAVIVLSWRLAKKVFGLIVQIAFVSVLLFLATRFGWIRW